MVQFVVQLAYDEARVCGAVVVLGGWAVYGAAVVRGCSKCSVVRLTLSGECGVHVQIAYRST